MDLTEHNLIETAQLLHQRKVSPVELTQAHLEQIQALNPTLNCFLTVTADEALKRARQLVKSRSFDRQPLAGIPLALKDLFETKGVRTTAGSKFFADYFPDKDAFVVNKLKKAGAILLGKLNMHEIALGVTNINPHYGACRNPWSSDRISGGSSGGSAVALAARMCMGSLGSDTGGSIRIPASLCGVVGLKPTYGRVSLRGVVPLSWSLDHVGPMGRTVTDVALLLDVISGFDSGDPASIRGTGRSFLKYLTTAVRGWRIGMATGDYILQSDPQILAAFQQAAKVFEQLGAHVLPVELPDPLLAARTNGMMVVSEAAAFHRQRLETRPGDFGDDILQRLRSGAAYTAMDYAQARRIQNELILRFRQVFEKVDILILPTTPSVAPQIDSLIEGNSAVEEARQLTRFTAPFNLTGLPAVSIPCGFNHDGLPIGLQLVGPSWAETSILRAAYAYEQATDWHLRRPPLDRYRPS